MRIALLIVAAGCWSSSSTAPPEPIQNTTPPRVRVEEERLPEHSVWRGEYVCAQGTTSLQLTLDHDSTGNVVAIFDFGPHRDNPTVPPGSYRLLGQLTEDATGVNVRLSPAEWISQPDGYMMVGLQAQSDPRRTRMQGRIDEPSCGQLDVRRLP